MSLGVRCLLKGGVSLYPTCSRGRQEHRAEQFESLVPCSQEGFPPGICEAAEEGRVRVLGAGLG